MCVKQAIMVGLVKCEKKATICLGSLAECDSEARTVRVPRSGRCLPAPRGWESVASGGLRANRTWHGSGLRWRPFQGNGVIRVAAHYDSDRRYVDMETCNVYILKQNFHHENTISG